MRNTDRMSCDTTMLVTPSSRCSFMMSRVIVAVTNVLARDDKEAALHAAREIPNEFEDKLEEVEIVVRPFAG